MDYTQMVGNTNELKCITAFMQLGFECSVPYGNGAKYDFIADDGEHLYKIQCKSSKNVNDHGTIREDAFSFSTVCQTTNTKETIRYTYSSKDVDYFATCFKGKVYIVPIEECKTSKTLRLTPPLNGQTNYSKAEDYLITNVFSYTQKLKDSYVKYRERNTINNEQIEKQKEVQEKIREDNYKIKQKEIYYCPDCGKEVSTKGARCTECASKLQRKVERPEREKLLELIQTQSFCEIGRMYEVTDNAVRRWCKSYNLPSTKYELEEYNKNPKEFKSFKREKNSYDPQLIYKIYNEGYNLKEISEFVGFGQDTVSKVLKQLGVETIRSGNSKKYGQYSLSGEFLRYFYSANEIREWFLQNENKDIKTGTSHINSCCNGNVSQAYGYIWKYEDRIPINEITI